jgi:hypothetical protein
MVYTVTVDGRAVRLTFPRTVLKELAAANTGVTVVNGRLVVERPNAKTIAAMKAKSVGGSFATAEELFVSILDAKDKTNSRIRSRSQTRGKKASGKASRRSSQSRQHAGSR